MLFFIHNCLIQQNLLHFQVEYPDAIEILNAIYQNIFANTVSTDELLLTQLTNMTKQFALGNKSKIETLPQWTLPEYEIDFGCVEVGKIIKMTLKIRFHGPGRLFACWRSEVLIPGLKVYLTDSTESYDEIR
jgi:hypothetical protein